MDHSLRRYLVAMLIAGATALLIRMTIVEVYQLSSASMADALLAGDYLLSNKFIYGTPLHLPGTDLSLGRLPGWRDPRPGEVVIFSATDPMERFLVLRCVAVSGQQVELVAKVLFVDGVPVNNLPQVKYTDDEVLSGQLSTRDNFGPYLVPEDHFFLMGDNRDSSVDSRMFRAVHRNRIQAMALIVCWSIIPVNHGYDTATRSKVGQLMDFLVQLPFRVRYNRLGRLIGENNVAISL